MDDRTMGFFWRDRPRKSGGLASQSFLTFHRTSGTRPLLTIIPHSLGSQHWELVSIHHPPQYTMGQSDPPTLHYHIYDSDNPVNNTTATDRPQPLSKDMRDFVCRAYGYPAATVFSVGTQFPVTSARQVGGMDCGVFVVRAAMHVIADTPFSEPAIRQEGAEAQTPELDSHYGWLLMAWRAELFLSVLLFSPPPDETDGPPLEGDG